MYIQKNAQVLDVRSPACAIGEMSLCQSALQLLHGWGCCLSCTHSNGWHHLCQLYCGCASLERMTELAVCPLREWETGGAETTQILNIRQFTVRSLVHNLWVHLGTYFFNIDHWWPEGCRLSPTKQKSPLVTSPLFLSVTNIKWTARIAQMEF